MPEDLNVMGGPPYMNRSESNFSNVNTFVNEVKISILNEILDRHIV